MRGTIDRFEGDFAIVEMDDNTMKDILIVNLPENAVEGSTIEISQEGIVLAEADPDRKAHIEKMMKDLWE